MGADLKPRRVAMVSLAPFDMVVGLFRLLRTTVKRRKQRKRCIALNHRNSLKGLNRPYINDTPPLTLAPQRGRKNSHNYQGSNLEDTEWGIPPSRDDQECTGAIIGTRKNELS